MEVERTVIVPTSRTISAEWTINTEEDIMCLYNADDEISRMIAEQIALDIDREIIESISNTVRESFEGFSSLEEYREEILVKKYGFR